MAANVNEFREKLKKLREQRKQASRSNFQEVLEENARAKKPQNWEKKLERDAMRLKEEEEKQQAEKEGQDYNIKKSMTMQADQLEKWDRLRSSKKRQAESSGFVDFETSTRRQYDRLTNQIKPDFEAYNSLKEELGEDRFYAKGAEIIPKNSLIRDSKEGIQRMVEDVHKQIEAKSKRSRRRRFDEEADVDYINERNMKFNQKLERFYGKYTDEIKQNFERGTAI